MQCSVAIILLSSMHVAHPNNKLLLKSILLKTYSIHSKACWWRHRYLSVLSHTYQTKINFNILAVAAEYICFHEPNSCMRLVIHIYVRSMHEVL